MPPSLRRPPSLARYPSYLAHQLAKAAMRLLSERLAPHGLRLSHFAVLAALDDLGPQCQRALCEVLDLDKSHMVTFVDDLEDRALVKRERDPEDRRRHRVAVTPHGIDMLGNLYAEEAAIQQELFGMLTADQRRQLGSLLTQVVAAADQRRLAPDTDRATAADPTDGTHTPTDGTGVPGDNDAAQVPT